MNWAQIEEQKSRNNRKYSEINQSKNSKGSGRRMERRTGEKNWRTP